MLKNHPDKGGDEDKFKKVNDCLNKLDQEGDILQGTYQSTEGAENISPLPPVRIDADPTLALQQVT